MSTKLLGFVLLSFFFYHAKAATCKTTGSGSWGTNATWSCGAQPTCGDSLVIQAGHTASVLSSINLESCGNKIVIAIYGTLRFGSGIKLNLPCNSKVYIFPGGAIVGGGGGGNSNQLVICGSTVWNAGMGTFTGPGCMPPTLPGCTGVLPIELISFEGRECNAASVCLEWRTASEVNNDFFIVERSKDGLDFFLWIKSQAVLLRMVKVNLIFGKMNIRWKV